MVKCTLCAELGLHAGAAPWNRPLIETANFAVIPSLGALVEGWLLIVPKDHLISLGALPEELRSEADGLECQTRALLSARYDLPVVAFEHGPSVARHGTGCGVDHAHLHLVPLACDLLRYVRPFVPAGLLWQAGNWDKRNQAYTAGLDYLYLKPDGGEGLIGVSDDFGSQVFRRAIATSLGLGDQFSWREYRHIEIVNETIETLNHALTQPGGRTEHAT
jgi:ATP adenylyltransferase